MKLGRRRATCQYMDPGRRIMLLAVLIKLETCLSTSGSQSLSKEGDGPLTNLFLSAGAIAPTIKFLWASRRTGVAQHLLSKAGHSMRTCNPRPGEVRTERHVGLASASINSRLSVRACFNKNKRWKAIEEETPYLGPLASQCLHRVQS